MKTYCDKCKKIDVDSGVMIEMNATVMKYTNLKKTLLPEFERLERTLNRVYANFNPITFCADCFIDIFSNKKYHELGDSEKGVPDETPNTTNSTI